jgi:hypothetical protein
MPISREDFLRGRVEESDEEKVIRFLTSNRGAAYNSVEIAKAIGHKSAEPPSGTSDPKILEAVELWNELNFLWFLDGLASAGKIDWRMVQVGKLHDRYFAAKS